MNRRILVSREAHEPHLALLFGLCEGFRCSTRREDQIRVVVIDHLMDLPHVDVIGLQSAQ